MSEKNQLKAIFFDMDGVLFDVQRYENNETTVAKSTWNVVFNELGIYHEYERLKKMYTQNSFPSYMEWTDVACQVLQKNGLTEDRFTNILSRIPLMNGAPESLKELRKRGYKTGVITGSFEALGLRAQKLLSLDYVVGHCRLIFDGNGYIKSWSLIPCDFEGKITYLRNIAYQLGLSHHLYVGDDVNDIPIFREVGLSIAFNCDKDMVKKAAKITINKKDLREILQYI